MAKVLLIIHHFPHGSNIEDISEKIEISFRNTNQRKTTNIIVMNSFVTSNKIAL